MKCDKRRKIMQSPNALFQKGAECETNGNIFGAIENYRAGFRSGSIEAAEALVQLYTSGKYNIHPDNTELIDLLEKLSSVNSPLALMKLAIINIKTPSFLGQNKPDYQKAATLLEKAATLGEPMAAFVLGEIIYYGTYLPKVLSKATLPGGGWSDSFPSPWCRPYYEDAKKAFQWYKIASDNGIGAASNMLGILKFESETLLESASFFERGANQGSTAAMTNLGVMHITRQPGGGRLAEHRQQTRYWLNKAAVAGFPEAMIALACDLTVTKDPQIDLAYKWICAAAKAGNTMGAQLKVLMDGGTRRAIGLQGIKGTQQIFDMGYGQTLYRDIW